MICVITQSPTRILLWSVRPAIFVAWSALLQWKWWESTSILELEPTDLLMYGRWLYRESRIQDHLKPEQLQGWNSNNWAPEDWGRVKQWECGCWEVWIHELGDVYQASRFISTTWKHDQINKSGGYIVLENDKSWKCLSLKKKEVWNFTYEGLFCFFFF